MTNHTDTSRSGDLVERIEGCIANAEYDDEWETLIDARDRIEALEAEVQRLNAILSEMNDIDIIAKTMAENERLRTALRSIAMRKTGGPHRPGQIKAEHRGMIEAARAALGEKQ